MKKLKIKLELFTLVVFSVLIISPLSAKAISFENFFEDFEEWISEETNNTGGSNSSQIINEVNVSANTGGNTVVDDGEVIEGEGKTEIHIENIINGESIDPVDIHSTGSEVNVESEIKVEDNKAEVERKIEIDSEKKTENYEIDLEDSATETENSNEQEQKTESETENEEVSGNIQNWWSDFTENLKSFFQSIFSIF